MSETLNKAFGLHAQALVLRAKRAEESESLARLKSLTPREREVMDLVVEGKLTKQIARQLGISQKTVEVHRSNITRKMGVDSVAQLVKLVTRLKTIMQVSRFACVASSSKTS